MLPCALEEANKSVRLAAGCRMFVSESGPVVKVVVQWPSTGFKCGVYVGALRARLHTLGKLVDYYVSRSIGKAR